MKKPPGFCQYRLNIDVASGNETNQGKGISRQAAKAQRKAYARLMIAFLCVLATLRENWF
jgi:hypothetical protein